MPEKIMQNPKTPSHLKDLILLFAVPIGIAVFAALIIYTPRLFANPKHDFVYSYCKNYNCRDSFNVDGAGHVTLKVNQTTNYNHYENSTIHYYSADSDSTRALTLEEARKYRLDTSSKSPDGYSLAKEESDSGFLFWGDYNSGWYLKNGVKKKPVELSSNDSYYSQNINFLGWVEK